MAGLKQLNIWPQFLTKRILGLHTFILLILIKLCCVDTVTLVLLLDKHEFVKP